MPKTRVVKKGYCAMYNCSTQIIIETEYSEVSGVREDLVGEHCETAAFAADDLFGIVGYILSQLSQSHNIKIDFVDMSVR